MSEENGSGGGQADLSVHADELGPVGEEAGELANQLPDKGLQASGSSYSAVPELLDAGLESGAALRHTTVRFFEKTMDLVRDCRRIEERLSETVTSQAAMESDTIAGLRSARYTPASEPPGNPALDALAMDA